MYKIFEQLCQERNVTPYKVSKATGISQATLSEWKRGNYVPKNDKLQKIAEYFGVCLEYLITGTGPKKSIAVIKKEEHEITKILDNMRETLETQEGLMFDGDPATPEAIESILSAMEIGLHMAKKKNKEKYTPNKFKS